MLFLRVIAWYGAEKFSLKKVVSIFTSGGDMSIVGTRPPTLDEWNKYELHHRARLAIKPGMHYVQDYQIHLIDPAKLTEEDLKKFTSSLREVIEYIKYSKDKEKLSRILKDNSRMLIDREAALV